MGWQENILEAQKRLQRLAMQFNAFVADRALPRPAPTPSDPKEAHAQLKNLSAKHSRMLYAETDDLLKISELSQEQVSLLLRYRPAIMGDDANGAANAIHFSLKESADAMGMGTATLPAALSYDPARDKAKNDTVSDRLSTAGAETSRLIHGIVNNPLSPEQTKEFHSRYETPTDLAASYMRGEQALAETYTALAEKTLNRAEHTMTYVGAIDAVVKPTFPTHAAGMESQALDMLAETQGTLQKAAAYLNLGARHGQPQH